MELAGNDNNGVRDESIEQMNIDKWEKEAETELGSTVEGYRPFDMTELARNMKCTSCKKITFPSGIIKEQNVGLATILSKYYILI